MLRGMARRWGLLVAVLAVLALGAGIVLATRPRRPGSRSEPAEAEAERSPLRGRRDRDPGLDTAGAPTRALGDAPTTAERGGVDGLRAALASGDHERARAAAASLRHLLRTDLEALRDAERLLLDPGTPAEFRQALALVLGTLPDDAGDPALLQAIDLFGGDPAFARAVMLALGATREPPEDDEVFDLGDRPWGAEGPGGLGITVRREIQDDAALSALGAGMQHETPSVRRAAAVALRHSLAQGRARSAFTETLRRETEDAVVSVVGEAMSAVARTAGADERAEILSLLLARAGEEPLDGLRFRMEDDLQGVPLDDRQRAVLGGYAAPSRPFGTRAFALTVLTRSAVANPAQIPDTRALMEATLRSDDAAEARDLAARLLGELPPEAGSARALVAAVRDDLAWNVRWSALGSLAGQERTPEVVDALRLALEDADPRVAERARELAPGR